MTTHRIPKRILVLSAALALCVSACAQERRHSGRSGGASSGPATDTAVAVHAAEAASRTLEERMAAGEKLFATHCSACHQADGQGLPGAFPRWPDPTIWPPTGPPRPSTRSSTA